MEFKMAVAKTKEDITYALKELSKKENVRAEELNNDNFIQLFCSLKN